MDIQGEFVKEFAKRTRKNLEYIDSMVKGIDDEERKLYEVTQLVNSLLGLLVFPQQEYVKKIPKTPLKNLGNDWPRFETISGKLKKDNLNCLIKTLRNGVAHRNLEIDSKDKKMNAITIWNKTWDKKDKDDRIIEHGEITWKGRLNIDDLRKFVMRFSDCLISGFPKEPTVN